MIPLKVVIIFTWIITLTHCSLQKNNKVIIIDHIGLGSTECCIYGKCHCSNFSLALEYVQDNTKIRITSNVPLHNIISFGNISNVNITGDSNPTVRCDHQGGLVGKNIDYIVIQGIIWDSCDGIEIDGFYYAYIVSCIFQYSLKLALQLNGFLDSSLIIKRSEISYNGGGISVSTSFTLVDECSFISNRLYNATLSIYHDDLLQGATEVIINGSNFIGNSRQTLLCEGPNFLHINSSNFINNTCSAVTLSNSHFVVLSNVYFYNNIVNTPQSLPLSCANTDTESTSIYDGAGIHLCSSTVNITESVSFLNNWASGNGGAIYIDEDSNVHFDHTTTVFTNNTARNGGAIYTSKDSSLHVHKSYLKFINNAADNGGAIYMDQELGIYLNITMIDLEFINNTAKYGGALYVNKLFSDDHVLSYYLNNNTKYFKGNVAYKEGDYVYFNSNSMDDEHWVNSQTMLQLNMQWTDANISCNDIGHYINGSGDCVNLTCATVSKRFNYLLPGMECPLGYMTITPGYWYDNGFKHYVIACMDFCNFNSWYDKILPRVHPNRDLQCNGNWSGFACGECNYNANCAIKYDTKECVPVDECLTTSVTYSLLILLGISFVYWIIVISFIFVLLHFKFDITAGAAYGIIFYYSVLEQVSGVFDGVINTRRCGIPGNENSYYDCAHGPDIFPEILQFFLIIGNLKPPFMQYMSLCLDKAEIIDHLFLSYIHPLIVMLIVTVIYVSARNFGFVYKNIGRYVNSKSICILLLLSYSSVSYNSLQLLIPLPYFKPNKDESSMQYGIMEGCKVYWSPGIEYFHGRHAFYAVVALLCELIIGIGLPMILLLQRRLTDHFNINMRSIRHTLDELQGCYKSEFRWFIAYYLICRQVIYVANILSDILLWMCSVEPVIVELITLLSLCSVILAIHLWFQPYRRQDLNILDTAILSTLVLQLVCSLDGKSYGITIVFWILPLIFFINYLTYSTKSRHLFALCSIFGYIISIVLLVFLQRIPNSESFYYLGVVSILLLLISFCFLVLYIIVILRRRHNLRQEMQHVQENNPDEGSDTEESDTDHDAPV